MLRDHADAYAYVAPAMIGMLVLVFFPFFYGIGLAFTDTTLFNESAPFRERWVGLDNFLQRSGFVGHGFMMAPAVTEAMAAWMTGGPGDEIFERFTVERFARGDLVREDWIIG